jgi:hypothetical protein
MDFQEEEIGFPLDDWTHMPASLGAPKPPPPAPPPPPPADFDPAFRPHLERLFTIDWVAEPIEVQHELEAVLDALVKETAEHPQEVWTSFEKQEGTGQVRAVERRLRNVGAIRSSETAYFVVKMAKTDGPFEHVDFWHETSVENLDRNVRFGIRTKPDHFQRERPD